jgi:lipopolysaccharide transport system permease protein
VDLRQLWDFRELAVALAGRDVKLRYRQTLLGVAWAVIQPLLAAAIFAAILGRVLKVTSEGLPYIVFVYAGLSIWTYVSTTVDATARSLVDKSELVRKIYFPRLLAPIAATLPGLIDLAISLLVLVVFMALTGVAPGLAVLLVPVWVGAAVALAFTIGMTLAALNVEYRDVRYALGFLVQIWLFASPVVYPSSLIDGWERYLYALNPVVGVLDGFRWSALGAQLPPAADLLSIASTVVLFVGGLVYFRRAERRFADVI